MKIRGASLALSSFEKGLWFDRDQKKYQPKGWGIKLDLIIGPFARPISKFWRGDNPWIGKVWFTIRLPFIILPFLSVAIGKYGFYFGGKVVNVDPDEPWARPEEYGTQIITFSVSIRRTRWV